MRGQLTSVGEKKLGLYFKGEFYKCSDCDTEYPVIDNKICCNGNVIIVCPWCRDDTRRWQNGRGI